MTSDSSRPAGRRGGCLSPVLTFIVGVFVTLLIIAIVVPAYALQHRTILPGEDGAGAMAISMMSSMRAEKQDPVVTTPAELGQGRMLYTQRCQGCHGQTGEGNGPQSQNLFPPPRSLKDGHAATLSDAQLVFITENGLSYTAMPSYKANLNREQVRLVVGYIRTIQNGTNGAVPVITPAAAPGGAPGGAPGAAPSATPRPAS